MIIALLRVFLFLHKCGSLEDIGDRTDPKFAKSARERRTRTDTRATWRPTHVHTLSNSTALPCLVQSRNLWAHHYPTSDAVIFVIDSTDSARFDEVKHEIQSMCGEELQAHCVLLFFANKQVRRIHLNIHGPEHSFRLDWRA